MDFDSLLLDLRPWLIGSTHELLVMRVFAEDGRLSPCLGFPSSLFPFSMDEPRPVWEAWMDVLERPGAVACRDGQGRRRRRVAHLARQVEEVYHKQRGTIGLPLSHRLSQAVGIGASRASQPPTCSLKSHLTVRCVRPGANVSWHFASTAFNPPVPSSTIVDRDGTGLLRSVCLGQGLRLPLQRVRSETGRLSFDTAQRRPKLVLKRVCRCTQRGVIPYTICALDSPVPSSQGLIGTLGGLDGRYTLPAHCGDLNQS